MQRGARRVALLCAGLITTLGVAATETAREFVARINAELGALASQAEQADWVQAT